MQQQNDLHPEKTSVDKGYSYYQYVTYFLKTQPEYAVPISHKCYTLLLAEYEQIRREYYEQSYY